MPLLCTCIKLNSGIHSAFDVYLEDELHPDEYHVSNVKSVVCAR